MNVTPLPRDGVYECVNMNGRAFCFVRNFEADNAYITLTESDFL